MLLIIDSHASLLKLALSIEGKLIDSYTAKDAFEHNKAITLACENLLKRNNFSWQDLKGIGIISGPGSYTGLRVGVSTAKGFCFALDIPLLAVNMLDVMTKSFLHEYGSQSQDSLLLPVVDARRMEVFTRKYNGLGTPLNVQTTFVFSEELFNSLAVSHSCIYIFGDGAEKAKTLYTKLPEWLKIMDINESINQAFQLFNSSFKDGLYQDLAYFEPEYGKPYFIKNVN